MRKCGRPEVTAWALDDPNDATWRLQIEGGVKIARCQGLARLVKIIVQTEPSGCSCLRAAPKPTRLASQYIMEKAGVLGGGGGAPVRVD